MTAGGRGARRVAHAVARSCAVVVAGALTAGESPAFPSEDAPAATVDPSAPEAQPWFRTEWYGVHVGEVKVGWMRRALVREKRGETPLVAREIRVLLDVSGDGNDVETSARTVYSETAPQVLVEATSETREPGRRTIRTVVRGEGRMDVVTVRRGERTTGSVGLLDVTLADELAAERLAHAASVRKEGAVGAASESLGIDLSTLVETRRRLSVVAERGAAGAAREFDVTVAAEGRASETFTVDAAGVVLRGTLGARFTFRREPEAQAVDPSFRAALAAASRIPLEPPLTNVAERKRITLRWETSEGNPFLPSPRQTVRREGRKNLFVTIARDADSGPADDAARAAALLDEPGFDLSDPRLREGAARHLSGLATRSAQVTKLLEFVRTHVRDEDLPGTASAAEVLRSGRGDASEHARLFAALCRAAGIPAREIRGLRWLGDAERAFGRHVWVEVALDGRWRPVDPWTGADPADAAHVALDSSPQAAAALLGARFALVSAE